MQRGDIVKKFGYNFSPERTENAFDFAQDGGQVFESPTSGYLLFLTLDDEWMIEDEPNEVLEEGKSLASLEKFLQDLPGSKMENFC
jgi:hypothetical protein